MTHLRSGHFSSEDRGQELWEPNCGGFKCPFKKRCWGQENPMEVVASEVVWEMS